MHPGAIDATRLTAILDPHVRNAPQGDMKIAEDRLLEKPATEKRSTPPRRSSARYHLLLIA